MEGIQCCISAKCLILKNLSALLLGTGPGLLVNRDKAPLQHAACPLIDLFVSPSSCCCLPFARLLKARFLSFQFNFPFFIELAFPNFSLGLHFNIQKPIFCVLTILKHHQSLVLPCTDPNDGQSFFPHSPSVILLVEI